MPLSISFGGVRKRSSAASSNLSETGRFRTDAPRLKPYASMQGRALYENLFGTADRAIDCGQVSGRPSRPGNGLQDTGDQAVSLSSLPDDGTLCQPPLNHQR